ncbi:hypothetical protein Vadar_032024 [Vaccinium darrowii]|uniref:Uncharacterized protein n=1 Tax=Vaccinium darrowii TaxID=229202 RepID=A0ACB7XEQ5_9ERIC|nr:hypothetical protein Vadar_032024 [Vaccinium darrowii]
MRPSLISSEHTNLRIFSQIGTLRWPTPPGSGTTSPLSQLLLSTSPMVSQFRHHRWQASGDEGGGRLPRPCWWQNLLRTIDQGSMLQQGNES